MKILLTQLPLQQSPPSQPHSSLFNASSQNPSPQKDDALHVGVFLHIPLNSDEGADDGALDGAPDGGADGTRLGELEGTLDGPCDGIRDKVGAKDGLDDGAFSNAVGSKQD